MNQRLKKSQIGSDYLVANSHATLGARVIGDSHQARAGGSNLPGPRSQQAYSDLPFGTARAACQFVTYLSSR